MAATRGEHGLETAMSGANRATLLYPLTPIGLGSDQCESIASFVSRLAVAHQLSIAVLIRYLDGLIKHERKDYNHLQTLLLADNDALVSSLIAATGCDELGRCKLNSLSRVLNFRSSPKLAKLRHCPVCLAESRFPDSWCRLIWEVVWVEACPRHNVLLVESVCGCPQAQWFPPGSRFFRPGVCRFCGSISFGCSRTRPRLASAAQRWIALEAGKLIASQSGGEDFTTEALYRGLDAAIKLGWEGNFSAAQRALGLRANYFSSVFHSWMLLDVTVLFALCSHLQLEPGSVLRGWPTQSDMTIKPLQCKLSRPRKVKTNGELECDLTNILSANPGVTSLGALAKELRTTIRRIKRLFPELAVEVHHRRETSIRRRKWRRLLRIGRALLVVKRQFAREGRRFGIGSVHFLVRGDPIERRLFEWVRQRKSS